MYAGSKYESHYTVWTAWISIRVRVRVRVHFILQNLAPLALPYMCPQPLKRSAMVNKGSLQQRHGMTRGGILAHIKQVYYCCSVLYN